MPTTLYPRSTLKRIIRAHSNRPLSKIADILIFLDYLLFMQTLLREAAIASKRSDSASGGELLAGTGKRRSMSKSASGAGVNARSVRRVRELCLRKFKG